MIVPKINTTDIVSFIVREDHSKSDDLQSKGPNSGSLFQYALLKTDKTIVAHTNATARANHVQGCSGWRIAFH